MEKFKERLEIAASIAEIAAALGVIVSLVYLATEISGNTNALRAQAHDNLLNQFNQPIYMTIEDPELGTIVRRGNADPESLTDDEWTRYRDYLLVAFNAWEYGYYLDQDGSVPRSLWEGGNAFFSDYAATKPGAKKFWKELGFVFAEPFHSYAARYFEAPIEDPVK